MTDTPKTALERSFIDLCEANGLTCLGVNYSLGGDGYFTVYVHSEGICSSAHGEAINETIRSAIERLNAKRSAALADEALPIAGDA